MRSSPASVSTWNSWAISPPIAPVSDSTLIASRLIRFERVRILHNELAHAQQPRTRPRFVATFRLEVIDHHRELAVREDLRRRVRVHGLFVRVAHHELAPVVV